MRNKNFKIVLKTQFLSEKNIKRKASIQFRISIQTSSIQRLYHVTENAQTLEKTLFPKIKLTKDLK